MNHLIFLNVHVLWTNEFVLNIYTIKIIILMYFELLFSY